MQFDEWQRLAAREEELHPELAWDLVETDFGLMLDHPLVGGKMVDPHRAAQLNQLFREKVRGLDQAWDERDWHTWIWLHRRPYRLNAFDDLESELSNQEYWSLPAIVWIDAESVWCNQSLWRQLWNADRPDKQNAMEVKERKAFVDLPDEITVYRGAQEGCNIDGMSWTLDRDVAVWFATNRHHSPRVLLTARAKKSHAHALLLSRKESELVHDKVEIIAMDQLGADWGRRPRPVGRMVCLPE
jgi:hypothetical protein